MGADVGRPVVVIAEDEADIAGMVAETLAADVGVETVVVSNGALVVDAVIAAGASLLILDINMPGATGIDVYDVVRNQEALAHIPVLFLTANPELAADALPGRAPREVMAKPFDIECLVLKVKELLAIASERGPRDDVAVRVGLGEELRS